MFPQQAKLPLLTSSFPLHANKSAQKNIQQTIQKRFVFTAREGPRAPKKNINQADREGFLSPWHSSPLISSIHRFFSHLASPLFCLLSHLHLSAAVTRNLSHTSDMTSLSSPSLKLLPSPLPLSSRSLPYPPAMFPAKLPLSIEPYPSRIPPSYSHGFSISGTGGQHQPTTYFTLSHPTPRSSRFPLVSVRGGR